MAKEMLWLTACKLSTLERQGAEYISLKWGGGILGLSLDTMMQQSRPKTTMAIEHCYQDTINGPINTKRAAFLFCGF